MDKLSLRNWYCIHLLFGAAFLATFLAPDFFAGLLAATFCGVAWAEPVAWAGAATGVLFLATLLAPVFLAAGLLAILFEAPDFLATFLVGLLAAVVLAIKRD